MTRKFKLIHNLPCKICGREYLWTSHRRRDFRCDKCRNHMTVEEVEKELKEMDHKEYQSFMQDIAEYEEENGPVVIPDIDKITKK